MNFSELVEAVLNDSFPEGRPENLEAVHKRFVVESLWDLQKAIPCIAANLTNVYPHCASYFECGLTVIPKPVGQINRLYVIDRINPDTGLEDADAVPDWCTKVHYQQVEWCALQGYVRLCERCSGATLSAVADAAASAFFGVFRRKRAYPRPTDEGFESLPSLPQGFHYPQSSTDAGGRSPSGVWAVYRGRIYIAPWIQSTETVVVEFSGIKRTWNDSDLVEDDPKFLQAVRLHVQVQHEQSFGDDPGKLQRLKYALYGGPDEAGAIPLLIHECNEQNRLKRCGEAGIAGISAAAARGMGDNTAGNSLFYNERQEYTATCPTGQEGNPVRVVSEAGTVSSALSVADANARAYQQAADEANRRLVCETPAPTYYNTPQSYTASCPAATEDTPAADGSPVTVTIAANEYSSTVSQAAADAAALAAATSQANAQRSCTFWNSEQEYTAECVSPATGDSVTKAVAAHTFSSTVSQADANALALAEATKQANEELVCDVAVTVYYNTLQPVPYSTVCNVLILSGHTTTNCLKQVTIIVYVAPGRFTSTVGQDVANGLAQAYGLQYAQQAALAICAAANNCNPISQSYNV